MELIAKLVEAALAACYDCCVIDWLPGEGAPESFLAECEFVVSLAGVLCFVGSVGSHEMQAWHAEKIEMEVQPA